MNKKKYMKIVNATFTSVWDGDAFETDCKVNLDTKEVFDIKQMEIGNEYNCCNEEYVRIDGQEYLVYPEDDMDMGTDDYWYCR